MRKVQRSKFHVPKFKFQESNSEIVNNYSPSWAKVLPMIYRIIPIEFIK